MVINSNNPETIDMILENIVYPSLEEILSANEVRIEFNRETVLFGENAVLNSLELVSFIVVVEERINENMESNDITLTSEKAMSRSSSPFKTVGTLAEYIEELLEEESA
ncbi:MAG: hypothetical protein NAG76_19025 [Candidatus Pristimantibacillus lignocellulolyticus]|uniref:Carrier domain-containing protein n=1 Tax=Candidatus Pristimantibacillus lignocellulolyticus TaxID=2994561 RepID=A0A9J6ZDA4_9BACL|nr:MAG: hypothetical protein NAG76_19025 [Candidatus Pristimantibacillus lignocellulolyticus]